MLESKDIYFIWIIILRLTTGVFKWSKDYLSAVVNFDEAGKDILL